MKDWIMELCPEIVAWQAELIAEEAQKQVLAEREACAKVCDSVECGSAMMIEERITAAECARKVRARGEKT